MSKTPAGSMLKAALESKKTMSRKSVRASQTASGINSRVVSQANSRVPSAAQSRAGSENGDDGSDDSTEWSVASIDELDAVPELAALGLDDTPGMWESFLAERIEELLNTKRSSKKGRETCLSTYTFVIAHHYAQKQIAHRLSEIITSLLKTIRVETTEQEAVLGIRALVVTLITSPNGGHFNLIGKQLKRTIENNESMKIKSAAIQAYTMVAFFGGASTEDITEAMEWFLEIARTDGDLVDAPDNGSVVLAALESWGLLATSLEDGTRDISQDAIEVFADQIQSADANVAIAAADNICLLYENCVSPKDPLGEQEDFMWPLDESDLEEEKMKHVIKAYVPYREEDELWESCKIIGKTGGPGMNKLTKKRLHYTFQHTADVISKPWHGPHFSWEVGKTTGKYLGSRKTMSMGSGGTVVLDTWWKYHRYHALRRALGGGIVAHYEDNEAVFDAFPVELDQSD